MKGQITKHEFNKATILHGKYTPTCEHCEVQQVKNRTKYPGRTKYYLNGVLLSELPKCITRKKPEDESIR
jgi:hypothetical protein